MLRGGTRERNGWFYSPVILSLVYNARMIQPAVDSLLPTDSPSLLHQIGLVIVQGIPSLIGALVGILLAARLAMHNWQNQELRRQLHDVAFQCTSDLIWLREYFKVTRDPWSFSPVDSGFDEQVNLLHQTMQKLDVSMVKLEALTSTDVWKYMKPIRRSYIEYRQAIAAIQNLDPSSECKDPSIIKQRWVAVASGSESDEFGKRLSRAVKDALEYVSQFMLRSTSRDQQKRVTPPA